MSWTYTELTIRTARGDTVTVLLSDDGEQTGITCDGGTVTAARVLKP